MRFVKVGVECIERLRDIGNILYYSLKDLFYAKVKIKKNRINLIWWKKKENLGDYLSFVVYNWMLEYFNLDLNHPVSKTKYFMGIGSVITFLSKDSTVWGSGILSVKQIKTIFDEKNFRKLDIRSVRGPLTRHVLVSAGYNCPEIYGDPAILMPFIYKPENIEKKYEVSVVKHFSLNEEIEQGNLHSINIKTTDYKFFIDEICSSKKIISSSLHGIILAETYGIPAIFLSDGMEEQLFKFWDWYLSTGRTDIRFAKTIEEALEMAAMKLPELDEMRKGLIRCFPTNLWKEN